MTSFEDIRRSARERGTSSIAVAGEPDEELSRAVAEARRMGLAECATFADAPSAVAAVRSGRMQVLMKGSVDTRAFMGAILDRDKGLRAGRLISHVAVVEVGGRLILITDGGICLEPTLEDKADILKNVVPVARALGMDPAKVAVLAAVEKVDPRMPETVDARDLAAMKITGLVIRGPLAVDGAVSEAAARAKGLSGPVVGNADVLLVPSVLAGNMLAKGIMYFADCRFGGVAAGTSHPVCFLSRAGTADTKLNTMALVGVLMCGEA
ncbi:MAG: phosphate acyltransferase [Planctomycetota bacterium]|jgi:phosphate butyryltransferase